MSHCYLRNVNVMEGIGSRRPYGDSEYQLSDLSNEVSHIEPMLSKNAFICLVAGLNVMSLDRCWNGPSCVIAHWQHCALFNCKINKSKQIFKLSSLAIFHTA